MSIKMQLAKYVPDSLYLRYRFRKSLGKKLNLNNPQTFSEKLQWLKLHDRNPLYTIMADKYAVKQYVGKIIGEEYIVPLLGVWDSFDDIDFSKLPEKFVLKCTHDSSGMTICTDRASFDIKRAKEKLEKALAVNYYEIFREWPYKNIPHRIIAEPYIGDEEDCVTEGLMDYKFFCFNGVVKFCNALKIHFIDDVEHIVIQNFDSDWNLTPYQRKDFASPDKPFKKPQNLSKMLDFSAKLSKDIPFVRVDWYEKDGKLYFGELTFFPKGGFYEVTPDEYNKLLGDWIKL